MKCSDNQVQKMLFWQFMGTVLAQVRLLCTLLHREFNEGGSPAEGGEGSAQPQDMTPQQQHQQYLGDSRPELAAFPDIQWAGTPIPGEEQIHLCCKLLSIEQSSALCLERDC